MTHPATKAVMAAFHAADAEARFVGGCVRDALLKQPAKDIDIATPQSPQQVLDLLAAANIHAIPTGIKHGTVTAVVGTHHFEITTLRIDTQNDGRRAKVVFTDDWTQDAARRDFTINAMSCDEQGNVYDPFDGMEDLGKGWIRFVGEAEQRITEDVLRLLRFFRFYAQYGRPPISTMALRACRKLAPRLSELSGERVRGELLRILTAPNTADTITLMRAEQVLEHILPEAGDVGRLRMVAWLLERAVKIEHLEIDPVRRLAALLKPGLGAAEVEQVARRLKFSNRERAHLVAMSAPPDGDAQTPSIHAGMSPPEVRRACARLGSGIFIDRALLTWAADLALDSHLPDATTQNWCQIIETARDFSPPAFPLKGRDVLALGVPHGPLVGEHLERVKRWWEEQDFQPDRAACLHHLNHRVRDRQDAG